MSWQSSVEQGNTLTARMPTRLAAADGPKVRTIWSFAAFCIGVRKRQQFARETSD